MVGGEVVPIALGVVEWRKVLSVSWMIGFLSLLLRCSLRGLVSLVSPQQIMNYAKVSQPALWPKSVPYSAACFGQEMDVRGVVAERSWTVVLNA